MTSQNNTNLYKDASKSSSFICEHGEMIYCQKCLDIIIIESDERVKKFERYLPKETS